MNLRPFDPVHAPTVASWARTEDEVRAWCGRPEARIPPDALVAWGREEGVSAYALTEGSRPLAYGELWEDATEGEVEVAQLIVDPARRGQGVGGALATRLAERARTLQSQVVLRVRPDHLVALRCYRAAGFARIDAAEEAEWNRNQPLPYVWMTYARTSSVDDTPGTPAIDASTVARLIAAQLPAWAHLPIRAVEPGGWNNRTFRLGSEMLVRLPSRACYAAQVTKEQRWLPRLAPHLPLPVPVPLARGDPDGGYPWPWSVYRWIEGETATSGPIDDASRFAEALARFIAALQRIDPAGGPPPGEHNFFRGGPLRTYDAETRAAIARLRGRIDATAATRTWEAALDATWHGSPAWLHGDVSPSNLLVREGSLSAVIDFGGCGVGDPSCDLAIAWTLFSGDAREAFRAALRADAAMWERGRGWALWKALIMLAEHHDRDPSRAAQERHVVEEVLADLRGSG